MNANPQGGSPLQIRPPPRRSTRLVRALFGALAATVLLLAGGAFSFLMIILMFDSPLRTTSSDLVTVLLLLGVALPLLAAWLIAAWYAWKDRPWARAALFAGIGSAAIGVLSYAWSVGLAFFGG